MHVVPEAGIEKIQAYPTPKNVKQMQAFVGDWGFGRTLFPTWRSASIL